MEGFAEIKCVIAKIKPDSWLAEPEYNNVKVVFNHKKCYQCLEVVPLMLTKCNENNIVETGVENEIYKISNRNIMFSETIGNSNDSTI